MDNEIFFKTKIRLNKSACMNLIKKKKYMSKNWMEAVNWEIRD